MVTFEVALLGLFCLSLVQIQIRAELTCSPENTSAIRVTFDSRQNNSGHWLHSVGLLNGGLTRGLVSEKNTGPWAVDVDHQSQDCGDDYQDLLKIMLSFSVRPKRNPEYKLYPGIGYYKYHALLDTWAAAKAACEKEGAHLAIVNSRQEADMLKQLIVGADWAYTGLIKHDAKGEFTTIFGDPIDTTGYSRWYSGVNPASAVANYVGVIHRTEGTFSYSTITEKRPSICEQDLY